MSDSSPLLNYGPSTDPTPIATSTAEFTNQARVNLSASAAAPAYCKQVVLAVPIGPDPDSLYTASPTGSVSTNKWGLTSQIRRGGDLWTGLRADTDYATFIYDCLSETDYPIKYNLVFGVLGAVNPATGDTAIEIQELSSTTGDPSSYSYKTTSVPLTKLPPQFYQRNFVATRPEAPTVPATEFTRGAPVRLSWESNGTYFQLFAKGSTAPIYAGTATTFTVGTGVDRDTTFILVGSVTGAPGSDTPQGGYEPIYLYDALTLAVSNPFLTPSAVTAGQLTVQGATTLAATTTGALTASSASVAGQVQAGSLTGNTLSIGGSATVANMTVAGGTTLATAKVNGVLTASSIVTGGLTARTGPIAMFGPGIKLAEGITIPQAVIGARTDGMAVAQVLTPGNNGKSSFAYAYLWTAGQWFQCLGGTVGSFGAGWSDVMNNNPNSMCIPIAAGTSWSYAAANAGGNQLDSPSQIWWFPMGTAPSGEPSYRILGPGEADIPPPPAIEPSVNIERRAASAAEFIEALEKAFDKPLAHDARSLLAGLLRRV